MATNQPIPFGGNTLSKVRRVREKIKEDAEAIYTEFRHALKMSIAAGEYEAGIKGYMWLTGHIPADEEGVRVVDGDVDKKQETAGTKGPMIQIGIAVGPQPKQLSAEVIEIASKSEED